VIVLLVVFVIVGPLIFVPFVSLIVLFLLLELNVLIKGLLLLLVVAVRGSAFICELVSLKITEFSFLTLFAVVVAVICCEEGLLVEIIVVGAILVVFNFFN
jgi:hypothetical protein